MRYWKCACSPAILCLILIGLIMTTATSSRGDGACCLPDGSCEYVPEEFCTQAYGGDYLGDGIPCEPNPCPPAGACCLQDGTCVVVTEATCIATYSGIYQGDGIGCDPNPCGPVGACCNIEDGFNCQVAPEGWCLQRGGTYLGDGTDCDPYPCEQSPIGACCYLHGEDGWYCQTVSEQECNFEYHGVFQGEGTLCGEVLCDTAWGACCRQDGSCFVCDPGSCDIENGTFQGAGSLCDPDPCVQTPARDSTWGTIKAMYR